MLKTTLLNINLLFFLVVVIALFFYFESTKERTIKVGVLHSQTGVMADSELPVIDATLLAIKEINQEGGLLGNKVEPIVIDGQSNASGFIRAVNELIRQDVSVIFGGWTSSTRKAIKPIIEKNKVLFFYPVQYEGLEESEFLIYTGTTLNQQIPSTMIWAKKNLGKNVFLVGSDYVFPRAANLIIKQHAKALNLKIVGEQYTKLTSTDTLDIVRKIRQTKPDFIINSINGKTNNYFINELEKAKSTAPVISLSMTENQLIHSPFPQHFKLYFSQSYFQSIQSEENEKFIQKIKALYGQDRQVDSAMVGAYSAVKLWQKAVIKAKSSNSKYVISFIKGEQFVSPEGVIRISHTNNHSWKPERIGLAVNSSKIKIVWENSTPNRPVPFPIYFPRSYWDHYLQTLFQSWNNQWQAPSE